MKINDVEVGVKDIIEFYIRINDSARAKSDIAKLSAKDKARAFSLIAQSNASRDFKVEIARYFVNDLDAHIRRKAELLLEDLVPGWVADPASSILQVLRSAEHKGPARRNAAVRFLFGIVDADSLRITLTSLLASNNRGHIVEIIEIIEQYINESNDEKEQVKIFDASLDIVLSDEIEMSVKHHATNLLSAFFNKVATTSLGSHLKEKYIERQTEKAESVYRFLCSGTYTLNSGYLEDLLRPLQDGGKLYQLKILGYFSFLLTRLTDDEETAQHVDLWPDQWGADGLDKAGVIQRLRGRILKEAEELWGTTDDDEVKDAVMAVIYSGQYDKGDLLAAIRNKLAAGETTEAATGKLARMLCCFLKAGENEQLKPQAANLLLFKVADKPCHLAALRYLRRYVENTSFNDIEQRNLTMVLVEFAGSTVDEEELVAAWTMVFLLDPVRLEDEALRKLVLKQLRDTVEHEVVSDALRERLTAALKVFNRQESVGEKLRKAGAYLLFRLQNPGEKPTWDKLE